MDSLSGCFFTYSYDLRSSYSIHFGVAKDDIQGMSAHAWLRVGDRIITGIKGQEKYTAIGLFAWFPNVKDEGSLLIVIL